MNISIRVPWHDTAWDGRVCADPIANCHCVDYENIRAKKQPLFEIGRAGTHFGDLKIDDVPPCANESGSFLSSRSWVTTHRHPYADSKRVASTHGHLKETSWTMEPFTAEAVPFRWLGGGKNLEDWTQSRIAGQLPPDEEPPPKFNTTWAFNPVLQEAILDGFWEPIGYGSLAVFYTKGAHPIGDDIPRLVVGIGQVAELGPVRHYDSRDPSARRQRVWQRAVTHTLRPRGTGGLLVPFHDYLAPTGDPNEDLRRHDLLRELVIAPTRESILELSYRSEHLSADTTVSLLTQALEVIARIREHGIAEGDWTAAEEWLNARLADTWQLRGDCPGLGPVVEAMGLRLGSSLVHLAVQADPSFTLDPWARLDAMIQGKEPLPSGRFTHDVKAFQKLWGHLQTDADGMAYARLLSTMAVDSAQALRWWDDDSRAKELSASVSRAEVIANPYLVPELDRGAGARAPAISFETADRAIIHAAAVSPSDRTRLRAAAVSVLRDREAEGDTLLGISELRDRVSDMPIADAPTLPPGWISAEADWIGERMVILDDPPAVQLLERASTSRTLATKLGARCLRRTKDVPADDWRSLLIETINAVTEAFDPTTDRASKSLDEQADALQRILQRKATVLVGRAGTGKTTLLGALSRSSLSGDVIFLAPTGKARVRLESRVADMTVVQTVAQFLNSQGRYDGRRQEPIIGDACYDGHGTVVIDEASMLTEDTLAAVIATFTPKVKRVILVGDPGQLPPIGAGRPFVDLIAHLEKDLDPDAGEDEDAAKRRQQALARLTIEVRSAKGGAASDTLRLAQWFTGQPGGPDAERIFGDLRGGSLNDLVVDYWEGPDDLKDKLLAALATHANITDLDSFNRSIGMSPYEKGGWIVTDADKAESWQVLSPVRRGVWGCDDLNLKIHEQWRGERLASARKYRSVFGPQEIMKHDKVILLQNGQRSGYDFGPPGKKVQAYLANGEIGVTKKDKGAFMDIMFAGRPSNQQFGFSRWEFGGEGGSGRLELAYTLTVHKSQGSEFGVVVVILPRGRMAYRELLYTALTRSRDKLVLLVQGSGLDDLLEMTKPEHSETIGRNTNLFNVAVREAEERPFAQHLVHRAADGTLLRSKSELVIYSRCLDSGLKPMYEQRMEAGDGTWRLPDFTFVDAADEPIVWEHLGMMDLVDYRKDWVRKKRWYDEQHDLIEGENLFTTSEVGGLDMAAIDSVISQIKKMVDA